MPEMRVVESEKMNGFYELRHRVIYKRNNAGPCPQQNIRTKDSNRSLTGNGLWKNIPV